MIKKWRPKEVKKKMEPKKKEFKISMASLSNNKLIKREYRFVVEGPFDENKVEGFMMQIDGRRMAEVFEDSSIGYSAETLDNLTRFIAGSIRNKFSDDAVLVSCYYEDRKSAFYMR